MGNRKLRPDRPVDFRRSGRQTLVTTRCKHCDGAFQAKSRRSRTCPTCKDGQYEEKLAKRRTGNPYGSYHNNRPLPRRERTSPAKFLFARDFVEAYPAMRLELLRQMASINGSTHIPSRPDDEFQLSPLKIPTRRSA